MRTQTIAALCIFLLPSLQAEPDSAQEVSEIPLKGNRSLSDGEIRQHLAEKGIELGSDALSGDDIERAVRLIRQFYQDSGFPLVRVRRLDSPPPQRVQIDEGPQAVFGGVEFSGNSAFCAEELEELLNLQGRLDFNQLEEGLENIRQSYRNAGHVRAQVEQGGLQVVEVEATRHFPLPFQRVARNRVLVKIAVQEGGQYRIGEVCLPPLLTGLDIPAPSRGDRYDESSILDFRNQVGRHFASLGRIIEEFQILQRIDDQNAQVDLKMEFSLLPPLDVRWVEFEGNSRYPDSFYRRELTFDEGDALDPRKIARSLNAINSTGVLKEPLREGDVEVGIDLQAGVADVRIPLEEKKSRNILYSLTRTDLGGVNASLALSIANWLGLGESIGLELDHGGGTTGLALSLASRYVLGTDLPLSLSLRFFRRRTGLKLSSVDNQVQDVFHSRKTGFSGTATYRIRRSNQVGLQFTVERFTRPDLTGHMVLQPFWERREEGEEFWKEEIRLGTRLSLFSDSSQAWSWRPFFDYRQVGQESPGAPKFTLRLQGAYSRFSNGGQFLSERLFSDSDMIRGFAATTTGPWGQDGGRLHPLGGDAYLALNTEYEVSPHHFFSLAPFLDSGVNLTLESPQGFEVLQQTNRIWRASVGGEVRIRLPRPLPTARLIAAWNPLRLDRNVLSPQGLARLRDPKATLRLAFDPVF